MWIERTVKMKEEWRTYPKIWWLQANKFGEYRRIDRTVTGKDGKKHFVKLKPTLRPDGYKRLYLMVNGKNVGLLAHRVTATCFLPNPDGLPQVNHKNCQRDDNRVENLEWCTASYNQQYREKYGVSMTESQGHPLFAVNLETLEVSRFRSQGEAGRALNVSSEHINMVLKGKRNQVKGYWFTEDETEITERKIREVKANVPYRGKLFAVDLETGEVLHFESICEAGHQLTINDSSISAVLKGKLKTAGGYWFAKDKNRITKDQLRVAILTVKYEGGIFAVNLKTLEVLQFISQADAGRKLRIDNKRINDVLKGHCKQTHGWWFIYIDENAVEKIRTKFSNNIADKVAKIMPQKFPK